MQHLAGKPSPRLAWLAVLSVALGTFVMVTTEFLPIGLLSSIARDLRVSDGTAGWMVTTPGFVAAFAAPLAAFGLQRFDRRGLLLALTLLVAVSNAIGFASHDFATMLVGRLLLGVAVGSFWAFAGAVGRRLVDERHGGTATAIVMAGISVGTVLGLPLGTAIGHWLGWRAAFAIGGVLSLLALVAEALLLPRLASIDGASHRQVGEALREPALRAIFGFAALVVLGHFAAYTYLEPFLTQHAGLGASALSLALAGYGVAGLAGNFIGARLAARDVRRTFLLAAAMASAAIFALLATRGSTASAGLAVIAWGLAFGAIPTCIQLWIHEASPRLFEASSALMVTVFQLALACGALVGGLAADASGVPQALSVGALVVAAGVAAMLVVRQRASATSASEAMRIEDPPIGDGRMASHQARKSVSRRDAAS